MTAKQWLLVAMVGSAATAAGLVQAQVTAASGDGSCPRTRAEVRNECVAFMKTHRWDEQAGDWVPSAGGKGAATLPEGVTSREKIKAERDAFMRANKWNELKGQWEPVGGTPRDISTMSRADVQRETAAFMRTHQWDEGTATYILKGKK